MSGQGGEHHLEESLGVVHVEPVPCSLDEVCDSGGRRGEGREALHDVVWPAVRRPGADNVHRVCRARPPPSIEASALLL